VANVNRKASAEALFRQVAALKRIAGLVIQTHRAYESPGRGGEGRTQKVVAQAAGVSKTLISFLENGKIPTAAALKSIFRESGFNLSTKKSGGSALLKILAVIREQEKNLEKLLEESPP
jgi:DNA-binding XRE family transcriptional regulator